MELGKELTGQHCPDPLRHAFISKKSAHASRDSRPLPPEQAADTWGNIMAGPAVEEERMAYFHIPFCRTHCSYCGFFQNTSKNGEIEKYVASLEKEIELAGQDAWVQSQPFKAVYFGGGTPTDLNPDQIRRLGDAIRKYLPVDSDVEMTFESRFNGLTDEKISACSEAGFNRFSLGLQTFDTNIRRKMSRIDNQGFLLERLNTLSQLDNTSIVVDLIYGLPWQTMEHWQKDLELVTSTGIHGVDLYQLILMGNTRMAQSVAKGSMPAPGDSAFKAGQFQHGVEVLSANGWDRLSISHWGRADGQGVIRERNLYNHGAKAGWEIIPFGCGAGGKVNGHSIMLHRALEPYHAMVARGRKPIMAMMERDPDLLLSRALGAWFDLGQVEFKTLRETAGQGFVDHCMPLFNAWEGNGLAEIKGDSLFLTLAGQFWAVNMNLALNEYLKRYPLKEIAA